MDFTVEMSDSEDAFESADEGAEEKKETEQKQKTVKPPAKETSTQATAGFSFWLFCMSFKVRFYTIHIWMFVTHLSIFCR